MSSMKQAVNDDVWGRAHGFTDDGLIRAEVMGPNHRQSKRKKTKAWRNINVTIYDPPRRPSTGHPGLLRNRVRRTKIGHLSKEVRTEIEQLCWKPAQARDAVTRLGDLVR